MSIQLVYNGKRKKFIDAARQANEILKSEDFLQLLSERKTPYDESKPSDLDPKLLKKFFNESNLELTLKHYKRRKTIGGAFDRKYPHTIWVNINTTRSGCTYAAVLIHECVHALSYHTPDYDFTHYKNANDTNGNSDTAPYAIQMAVRNKFCKKPSVEKEDLVIVETLVSEADMIDMD